MALCILPSFEIFHSILVREASYSRVSDCREAFNIAQYLNTKHGVDIILPKLINDNLVATISEEQKPYFYPVVRIDNSASGEAEYDKNNCLGHTARVNSFKKRVIVITHNDVDANQFRDVMDNKKVTIMNPHEFITCYKKIVEMCPEPGRFLEFLVWSFFYNADQMKKYYETACNGKSKEK